MKSYFTYFKGKQNNILFYTHKTAVYECYLDQNNNKKKINA